MANAALVVFFLCLAVCAWVYLGYPALIYLLSRVRPRPVRKAAISPHVTIVVAAFNEEEVIEEKIRNCLAVRYPAERFETIIASNASTDRTDAIVREWEIRSRRQGAPAVRLVTVPQRGKAFALNEAARQAQGEILVFSDANTQIDADAVARMVANYADSAVGAVTGNKMAQLKGSADATAEGEGLYWRYEMWQKRCESAFGSCYIGDGSLHSVRRSLYVPITDAAQGDDIAISTRVVLQHHRLIYEPAAVVREAASPTGDSELKRKVRVTNRSLRALFGLGRALWTSGFYSLELISHKVLRHLIPFFLIPLFAASVALAAMTNRWEWYVVVALQVSFYSLAAAGWLLRRRRWARHKLLWLPFYFTFVNTAAFLGVLTLLGGVRPVTWKPRTGQIGK